MPPSAPGSRTTATAPPPLPDRPLDPPEQVSTVAVRASGRHPLIYRKMCEGTVEGSRRPESGDLVRIVDRDRVPIGYGLWNARSQIALRMISRGPDAPGRGFWADRLEHAVALRRDTLRLDDVANAYRVVHAEADGLSGLIVDRYDDVLSAEVFSLGMYQRIGPIVAILAEKLGTRHARVSVDARIAEAEGFEGRAASSPDLPPKTTIREHGVRYRVRFETGHKTGFFCDQRENRRRFASFCDDRDVLDACCYTGGFAVAARVLAKPREVTGVDLDENAVALARENANLNGVKINWIHSDAFHYLRQMHQNGRFFGAIVLDPPKLIARREDWDEGRKKYHDLNLLAMRLAAPGGVFLSCSCSGLMPRDEFLDLLRAAARRAGRTVRVLAISEASPDHPFALEAPEGAYLKAVWMRLDPAEGSETPTAPESE